MSSEIQLRTPDSLPDVADPLGSHRPPAPGAENILLRIHRILIGRYKWAILLGALLGGVLATAAYRFTKVQYTSSGTVFITELDQIIDKTPESERIGRTNTDNFKETQVQIIQSSEVIPFAMRSDEWRATGLPSTDDDMVVEFTKRLEVSSPPRADLIVVRFTHTDPSVAFAAVTSVLKAYQGKYVERVINNDAAKRLTVSGRRRDLNNSLKKIRDDIASKARTPALLGTDDVRMIHQTKLEAYLRVAVELDDIETQLSKPLKEGPAGVDPDALTDNQIALLDPLTRQLRRELEDLELDLKSKGEILGPNNRTYKDMQAKFEQRKAEYLRQVETYRTEAKRNPRLLNPELDPTQGRPLETREELLARKKSLTARAGALKIEVTDIGAMKMQIEQWQQEAASVERELRIVEARETQLETEKGPKDRIRVGEAAKALVSKDSRLQYGLAAGIFGWSFGVGVILLWAWRDRRFRNIEDVQDSGRMALLGVLPSLPDDLGDPQQAAVASHCVHQIRTLLQIGATRTNSQTFAITSPAAGTGKTSLTLSLGVSFAASNVRTLIIDCDIIGGGLTSRVDAIIRRKVGQILAREGRISPQQLETALRVAKSSHRKLGETLIELGYVKEEELSRALTAQEEMPVGMLDALAGEDLQSCVAETGIANLFILPLGHAMPADVTKLSPSAIRALLDRARKHFDIIIIDTGPVPGSLEASVAAAAADAVVLVVSRGEQRPMAEKSIVHLREIGARLAGMVFNRAEGRDLEVSGTGQRVSSMERSGVSGLEVPIENADAGKFGPVARALTVRVASSRAVNKPQL